MGDSLNILSANVFIPAFVVNGVIFIQIVLFAWYKGDTSVVLIVSCSFIVLWFIMSGKYLDSGIDVWTTFVVVQIWMIYSAFLKDEVFHFPYFSKFFSIFVLLINGSSFYKESWFSNNQPLSCVLFACLVPVMIFFPPAEIFIQKQFYRAIIIRVLFYSVTRTVLEIEKRSAINNLVHTRREEFDKKMIEFQSIWILFSWNWTLIFGFAVIVILGKRIEIQVRSLRRMNE